MTAQKKDVGQQRHGMSKIPYGFRGAVPERDACTIMPNILFRFFFAYSNSLSVIRSCQAACSSTAYTNSPIPYLPTAHYASPWPNAPLLNLPSRYFRQMLPLKSFKKKPPIARPAISGRTPRKRFSAKAAAQNQK
jgi:hypothetical protein